MDVLESKGLGMWMIPWSQSKPKKYPSSQNITAQCTRTSHSQGGREKKKATILELCFGAREEWESQHGDILEIYKHRPVSILILPQPTGHKLGMIITQS